MMSGIGLGLSGNLQTSEMNENGMSKVGKTEKKRTMLTEMTVTTVAVSTENHFLKNRAD